MRTAVSIELSSKQRGQLEEFARGRTTSVRVSQRSKMILMAADGMTDSKIAGEIGAARQTVSRWRGRFVRRGLEGIEKDAPRPGRRPQISATQVSEIVRLTTQEKPANATHWSTRKMAEASGDSEATVRRVWKRHGLKPHLLTTFKISKVRYWHTGRRHRRSFSEFPGRALILSVDEKSEVQALDRTRPNLPLRRGRAGTMLMITNETARLCLHL